MFDHSHDIPKDGVYKIVDGVKYYTVMPIGKGHLESFEPREPRVPDPEGNCDQGIFGTHPQNPTRSPLWRWLRAGMIRKRSVPKFRAWDDDAVREALEFRRWVGSDDLDIRASAVTKWPDIQAAVTIFESDGPLRWELEARVLAAESHAVIAERIRQPVGVVEAYTRLFFDLASRLRCDAFIHTHVIHSYQQGWDLKTFWKYYAFTCGPHMIDLLVEVLHPVTGTAPEIDACNVATLTGIELGCHLSFLRCHLSPSAANYRQLAALEALYQHFGHVPPVFETPNPTACELTHQLEASEASSMKATAQPRTPARTDQKVV